MATPNNIQYSTNPVEAVSAEAELRIFRSENSTYAPDGNRQIIIPLNCSDKSFIDFSDSVISMKFTNRSADASTVAEATCNVSLASLIQDLTIIGPQGNEIEVIRDYNVLNKMLDDYSYGLNHAVSIENVLSGASTTGVEGGQAPVLGSQATGSAQADGGSITLVDKLVCATLSNRYLVPCGWLVGQAMRISIRLADPETALFFGTAPTIAGYKCEDIQFRAKEIKFNSMFNATFEQTLAQAGADGLSYIGETFLHAQNNIPVGSAGEQNLQFSLNPRSAKYILSGHRRESDITLTTAQSLGGRISSCLTRYSYDIMGKQLPSQPIDVNTIIPNAGTSGGSNDISRAYSQVLDAFGIVGAVNRDGLAQRTLSTNGTSFYFSNTNSSGPSAADGVVPSKYLSAITLEDFDSSNNPDVFSGQNLSTSGPLIYRPLLLNAVATSAHRVDHYIACDIQLRFTIDGRMYSIK